MPCVLLALAAALLAPSPAALGDTAATTLGPGFALASGNVSASPAAGGASVVVAGPGPGPAPSLPAAEEPDMEPQPEPRPQGVMVDAPRRRFVHLRRCEVGYSWIRGLCRRIFGSDSTT